jgi:hypothetical protein
MDINFLSEYIFTANTTERSCGDCSACCEGYLTSTILGYKMGPGKPCKFTNPGKGGCTIYPHRPDDPCKQFKCLWKKDNKIPEALKPNLSKVILVPRLIEDIPYTVVVEAGAPLSIEVLDWVLRQFNDGKIDNIIYFYNGKKNMVSRNPKWVELMNNR